jgi:hypothetical protein
MQPMPVGLKQQHLSRWLKEIVFTDVRYTNRQISSIAGISLGTLHTIQKRDLKMKKICARWITHLQTD